MPKDEEDLTADVLFAEYAETIASFAFKIALTWDGIDFVMLLVDTREKMWRPILRSIDANVDWEARANGPDHGFIIAPVISALAGALARAFPERTDELTSLAPVGQFRVIILHGETVAVRFLAPNLPRDQLN